MNWYNLSVHTWYALLQGHRESRLRRCCRYEGLLIKHIPPIVDVGTMVSDNKRYHRPFEYVVNYSSLSGQRLRKSKEKEKEKEKRTENREKKKRKEKKRRTWWKAKASNMSMTKVVTLMSALTHKKLYWKSNLVSPSFLLCSNPTDSKYKYAVAPHYKLCALWWGVVWCGVAVLTWARMERAKNVPAQAEWRPHSAVLSLSRTADATIRNPAPTAPMKAVKFPTPKGLKSLYKKT